MSKSHGGRSSNIQKGSRRPDLSAHRDRGRRADGYQLGGGVPWPKLGDGTDYADSITRVALADKPGEFGRLQNVEWCHPDGSYMETRTKKATKTLPERPYPGDWFAIVSWDDPDREDRPAARQLLVALLPEP